MHWLASFGQFAQLAPYDIPKDHWQHPLYMTLCNLASSPATPGFEKLGVAGDEVNVTSIFANLKQAQVIKVLLMRSG